MKDYRKSPLETILRTITIAGSIPIVSFLVAFFSIGCFYRYCGDRLQLSGPDEFPPALQARGATLAIEPGADEVKMYVLSYEGERVSWVRSFDLDWGLTPTFVAADLDGDRQPEIVLTYTSSGNRRECPPTNSSGNFFNIASDFVVYDLEDDGIAINCQIPQLYAMYFSDAYRSFLFANSPIFTISGYFAIAVSFAAGVGHLGLWMRRS